MSRRPTPTKIKEQIGSFARHPERKNKAEPVAPANSPTMPETVRVCDIAAGKWRSVCEILNSMGMLSTADENLIERFCVTYSNWRQSLEHVRVHGLTVMADTQRGAKLVRNPAAIELHACEAELHRQSVELGLTPAARSRIQVPGLQDDDDPFTELLSRIRN